MRPPIEEEIEAAEVEVDDGQQTAVMLVSTRLAGNAVIRVVNRCNEAQESNNLGKRTERGGFETIHVSETKNRGSPLLQEIPRGFGSLVYDIKDVGLR